MGDRILENPTFMQTIQLKSFPINKEFSVLTSQRMTSLPHDCPKILEPEAQNNKK